MIDLDKLKELAKCATPGPWHQPMDWAGRVSQESDGTAKHWIAVAYGDRPKSERCANAAFIAAANPQTVLALCAAILRALDSDCAQYPGSSCFDMCGGAGGPVMFCEVCTMKIDVRHLLGGDE